jgi:protein O-mannosyl-transferase
MTRKSGQFLLAGVTLIVAVVFLSYLPSINGGFVLDDDLLLTRNKIIKAPDGLYRFWCTTAAQDYWPATNTSFWIEWRLWAMNPAGYHVTNLILHIIETLLIWLILRKLSVPGAFLAALIFALHPVNVESVSWIASRKNLTAMLFFLLSILWYFKYFAIARLRLAAKHSSFIIHHSSFYSWYCLSLAAFILAMLGKGSVVILPAMLLCIIWWLRLLTIGNVLRIVPFFLIAAVLGVLNVWFQTHGSGATFRTAGFIERLLGAGCVIWFYIYKAILPVDLAFIYPQWSIQADDFLWWLPLAAVLIVTLILWLYRNKWSRPLLFAWGFFCIALTPVMGFTDVGFMQASLVADHYQHVAILGLIALTASGLSIWNQRPSAAALRPAKIVAFVTVVMLAFLTWRQSGIYKSPITLYQATLEKNPNCFQACFNLANTFSAEGRIPQAIEQFERALTLKPDYIDAHLNLGVALAKAGRLPEAIEHCRRLLILKPDFPDAHNNLGILLVKTGQLPEAIECFEKALYLKPDYLAARCNLGNALVETGRYQEAVEQFERAMALKPDLDTIYDNLALAYAQTGQPDKAIAIAKKALDLARSRDQADLAKEIENWINSYRARIENEK